MAGRRVGSFGGVPPVVAVCSWTVRGRYRDWCWGPMPGNPRCCCVRVCQSPVLTRGSGGRRALSHRWGVPLQEVAAYEGAVRARRGDRRAQGDDQGRDPVPGGEAVDPQDRDPGVPDVLRGAPGDGSRAAPAGCHPRGDGGQRGVHRAGVLRAVRAGLHPGRGDQPGARQGAEGAQDRPRDCARLAELFECGLLRGSYIPPAELKEVRDLTRYRMKTVQARTSEIQRLGKALESAGIKLGSVASSITGTSSTAMIEALIDGERRGQVLADLAIGRMRTAGKLTDLSMALAGRFTEHHALLCRLHLDRIAVFDDAVDGLDGRITGKAARWQREAGLLTSVPGFGDVVSQA